MAKYPNTQIKRRRQSFSNGSPIYDVWRNRAPQNSSVIGTIERIASKTWRLTISTPASKNCVYESNKLGDLRLKAIGIWGS